MKYFKKSFKLFALRSSLFAILFTVHCSKAQDSLIELQKEPISIPNANFYIDKVIDAKKKQGNIGVINMGIWGKRVKFYLKSGVADEIYNYLNYSFPKDSLKVPITLRVLVLTISKTATYLTKLGRAEIKVEFYRNINGKPVRLYEAKAINEEQEYGVKDDNEGRIRKALTACLKSFNNSNWQAITSDLTLLNKAPAKNPVTARDSLPKATTEIVKGNTLFTFSGTSGINANGLGLSYYDYPGKYKNGWIVPFVITIEGININPDYFSKSGYQQAHLYYIDPGVCVLKKLNQNFLLNITLQFPAGFEMLTDFEGKNSSRLIGGLRPSEGIFYMFNSGITFGAGIYEKFLSSKVFKQDFGFEAKVGIKF